MKKAHEYLQGEWPRKTGCSTGWATLDEISGGMRPGQTWVFSSEDDTQSPLALAYQVLLGAASSPQCTPCLLLSTTVMGDIAARRLAEIYKAMCETHAVPVGGLTLLPFEKLPIYIEDSACHDKTWLMDDWLCGPIINEGIRIVMVDDWSGLLDSQVLQLKLSTNLKGV